MTVVNFPKKGIETAMQDDRVEMMVIDMALGVYAVGQVMLTHKMNAIEVAHDHGISITDVQRACELRIKIAAEAGRGDV